MKKKTTLKGNVLSEDVYLDSSPLLEMAIALLPLKFEYIDSDDSLRLKKLNNFLNSLYLLCFSILTKF